MSWGYFVSFALDVSEAKWDALLARTPASVGKGDDWAAWPNQELTWYFTPQTFGDQPLAKVFSPELWAMDELESIGLTVTREGGRVRAELFTMLDRSGDMMQESGCFARALVAACELDAGASGSMLIVSDGSAPEDGWRCSIKEGKVVTLPLDGGEAGTLLEELAARVEGG